MTAPTSSKAMRATLWLAVFIAVTAIMVSVRARLDRVHVTLAYLVVVQLASAQAGRAVGVTLAILSFLAFNFFFLPPYGTFALANPLDWLVLVAYLITSIISAQLLYRARALGAERARLSVTAERAQSLEQSNRMKDETLAMVSHDLRTPLTTIKGLAHEIAGAGDERAEVIEEEADRLNAFVGKLLDLSRVTMGTAALDVQPNEAEDLLGAAAQQAQGFGRELSFHVEPSDSMLFGNFDFVQSLRVLVNLIDNAAKYSPPTAPIDVGARRVGDELRFWVADRGPGIASEDRVRIFEPFYRRRVGDSDIAGAGLGLSIAKGIAEAQGGRLTFAARDGGGTVFTLTVPAIDLPVDDGSAIDDRAGE
ncbi:MAG TPA: ATP-binding protein [Gemmatimonadaceae bacterium]|jgi:two-component system sensor histidine kinase KdpD|nr:ATP-binding protein [Gemmatimonadaceae bacterium]